MTSILRRIELVLWLILAAVCWFMADSAAAAHADDAMHNVFTGLGAAVAITATLAWLIRNWYDPPKPSISLDINAATLKVESVLIKVLGDEELDEHRVH